MSPKNLQLKADKICIIRLLPGGTPDKKPFMATEAVAQTTSPGKPKKLLEQVRDLLRLKHYSLRTERSYCDWIERFIRFDSFASRPLSLSACAPIAVAPPATPFTQTVSGGRNWGSGRNGIKIRRF